MDAFACPLKKSTNGIYIRVARFGRLGGITAKIVFPAGAVVFNTDDLRLPHLVPSLKNDSLRLGIVVSNTTATPLSGLQVSSELSGKRVLTDIPAIAAGEYGKSRHYSQCNGHK